MSTPPPILIYAELLSNIRQVSVGCSLQKESSSSTNAVVSSDGLTFSLSHDGVKRSVQLPGRVVAPSKLSSAQRGPKSLAWRLPIAPSTIAANVRPAMEDQSVPWSASDLEPGSAVSCRACNAKLVKQGALEVWKDLPSENWAEMMEFWHCHKPHDHHKHDDGALAHKAYGANSRIAAQHGVGFVDLTSFLISREDLGDSVVLGDLPSSQSNGSTEDSGQGAPDSDAVRSTEKTLASCSACNTLIGISNDTASSVSLFKWRVSIDQQGTGSHVFEPSLAQCISAILVATVARSGCSKSILLPIETTQTNSAKNIPTSDSDVQNEYLLNIWVFNPNITFSSTEEVRSAVSAIKVLYRLVTRQEANKMMDSMTSDVQDISLPADAIKGITSILATSNSLLPESDRHFKEWTVGLIEKWVGPDSR